MKNPHYNYKDAGAPYYNRFLNIKENKYMKEKKGRRGFVKHMQPMQFLNICRSMQLPNYTTARYIKRVIDLSLSEKYAKQMKKRNKFPILVLEYPLNNHEGRHRAYASYLLRDKFVPVLVIRKTL